MKRAVILSGLVLCAGWCCADVSWRHIGAGMGGNSYWLASAEKDDGILYYTPDVGGVYRSTDGGRTWTHLLAEFLHENRGSKVTICAIAPSDPNVVYAGALLRLADLNGDGQVPYVTKHLRPGETRLLEEGLLKTADGGKTWQILYGAPIRPGAVAVDPDDPETVWAASPGYLSTCIMGYFPSFDARRGDGSVSRSTDGGRTWTHTYVACTNGTDGAEKQVCFSRLFVDRRSPKGNRTLYLSGSKGVWKSTDHGRTWTDVTKGLSSAVVGDMSGSYTKDGRLVLWVALAAACENASGRTRAVRHGLFTAHAPAARPGIFRSEDGGASWTDATGNLNPGIDRYRITVDPVDPLTAYTAQIRGTDLKGERFAVFKTADGGKSWRSVLSAHGTNQTRAVWNLRYDYAASPDTFIDVSYRNPKKIRFADAGCFIWESTDGGETWRTITSEEVGPKRYRTRGMDNSFILSLSVSPKNRDFLLMTCHDFDLLSSVDGGRTFFSGGQTGVAAAAGSTGGTFGFMSVLHDPNDPLVAYAGAKGWGPRESEGGCFVTTTDGGRTWHVPDACPDGLRQGALSDVMSAETLAKFTPIPGYANSVRHKGLTQAQNWAIRSLAMSPTGRLFASKRTGVYLSDDRGGHWTRAAFEGIGLDCDWGPNYVVPDAKRARVLAVVSYMPLLKGMGLYPQLHPIAYQEFLPDEPATVAGVYVSTDDGAHFRKLGGLPRAALAPVHLAVAADGAIYLGTVSAKVQTEKGPVFRSAGIWKSTDDGRSWTRVVTCRDRLESAVQGIAVHPTKPHVVYAAVKEFAGRPELSGIYRSTDGGAGWTDISGAAAHGAYCFLGLSPADPADILVGTAGGGAWIGRDGDIAHRFAPQAHANSGKAISR